MSEVAIRSNVHFYRLVKLSCRDLDPPRVKPHGDNESSTVDVKFSPKAVLFP